MHSGKGILLEGASLPTHSSTVGGSYDGKIAGLYDLEETLGSGHFAVVKLARHVFTGAKVAVKVVDKTKLDEVSKAHLFQEVRCMKLVQHPNVVRLYEVIDTQTKLYLVLELGDGGDLYDYIMKHEGGLSEELAKRYFRQILRAITYCHQLHVVHRDLKPENVVFFEKLGVVKLTDFGFSNKFSPGQKLETFCGSLAYSAPEILLGDSYDAPAVDIWSLGVILYMLVCGQAPFEKANDSETLTMIMDCKYTVPPQVTQNCRKLIGAMLVRDPKKRASLEKIAADPWLKENDDFNPIDFLPLVSRQELSEEDHAFIIQKMINGKIASKEDILQSLDKNQYNHITATYFLLAEMRLRRRREEEAGKIQILQGQAVAKQNCPDKNQTAGIGAKVGEEVRKPAPISINICPPPQYVSETKTEKRSRKCSIVREEDEDESSFESAGDSNELKVAISRRESISDGRINRSVQAKVHSGDVGSKLASTLNQTLSPTFGQIEKTTKGNRCFMNARKEETDNAMSVQSALMGLKELEIGKLKPLSANSKNPVLTHRRTKLNKIRTPSCSSSEASDDDTKSRSKKKMNKLVGDTPVRFHMHRRDSHDDSSDSQEQSFPSAGAHGHAANIIGNSSSNVDGNKGESQTQNKQNKTEETRKCCQTHTQKTKKHTKATERQSESGEQPLLNHMRRRRVRESQSLDRITEAQEYELRHRGLLGDGNIDQQNSLFDLNSISVAEIKEEYDEESQLFPTKSDQMNNSLSLATAAVQIKRNKKNMYNLNSIEEIDLILEDESLSKTFQVKGSKCFVTMKKIRKLGKYFPVVNFS